MPRRIIYTPEFDSDCQRLGGIPSVQAVIDPLVDALVDGDPTAFGLLDTSNGYRYARIRPVGNMPGIIVVFEIDRDDDVIMRMVQARF